MNLTYLPQWAVINQSQKQFVIQEDNTSLSIVSPINDYAMGILSQVYFDVDGGVITNYKIENNSKSLIIEIDESKKRLIIKDI
ncbi:MULTISPECIES: hypothetical protein [Staphylococcus]|uniref:Uncharacterized protein n=1 Tax=Staphylococcus shinii TaxID=2912228 RepID=A0A418IBW4_9STAP|nr:hypothetical protein [Staphylococcus shinii]MBO3066093.1 hypothetical protein [Staphylococcus shinii]MDW8564417.1 hypothetical protein [Staphylococcus shinii]MDW8567647.1 hypothetical protein [Staphylococcus shinii]MEC5302186.1 hypothetical protein [Staphylococcus shinii]OEK89674.1 hypothetical protein AST15_03935 [Staphylococcus shinii]